MSCQANSQTVKEVVKEFVRRVAEEAVGRAVKRVPTKLIKLIHLGRNFKRKLCLPAILHLTLSIFFFLLIAFSVSLIAPLTHHINL
jgi:hypothetical protein